MIKDLGHGWCEFTLGDFVGFPSYLTDVPVDLLQVFIDYYEKGSGVDVFDEEGSTFTLVLTRYNWGIFVIEEKAKVVLHDFNGLVPDELAKELISDIESGLNGWTEFISGDDPEEIKIHRDEIWQKLAKLKQLMKSE